MDFVFLAADGGAVKRLAVTKLEEYGIPFIDVEIAVDQRGTSLGGMVLVAVQNEHARTTPTRR